MTDKAMIKDMKCKIAELLKHVNEIKSEDFNFVPEGPLASVICAHLKFFICSIIQNMTFYKKKHKLNKKNNLRTPSSSSFDYSMMSVVVYEDTPFTMRDFFQMIKDNESIIPHRGIYQVWRERLLHMEDSVKPTNPKDEDDYYYYYEEEDGDDDDEVEKDDEDDDEVKKDDDEEEEEEKDDDEEEEEEEKDDADEEEVDKDQEDEDQVKE